MYKRQSYYSTREANRQTGVDKASIGRVANKTPTPLDGVELQAGGFMWSWVKKNSIDKYIKSKRGPARKVNQLDLSGNLITQFDTLSQAAEAVGLKEPSTISRCCKGKQQTSAGFCWEYLE